MGWRWRGEVTWTVQVMKGDRTLATHVEVADSFGARLLGLMFRRGLPAGAGLLLFPCNSVHTWFMRFPIDVLYLDSTGRVVKVVLSMRPWRFGPVVREARQVLELPAGAATGVEVGDQLTLLP
jgi:uncharacterized membrane protein (UPF0127 family)